MRYVWICIFLFCFTANVSFAQPANDEGLSFFEQKIRPVLVQHCYSCHSIEARDLKKLQGALYLDSAEGIAAGGESGPVIEKGKSAESRLIKALKYDGTEMPPSGKLSDEVIGDFANWIDMGAPDPRHSSAAIKPKREINIDDGKQWWSFRPLRIVAPPTVEASSRIQTPIDAFIADAWTKHKLQAAPAASKEKLIRRAYFDLIGLPPTPEQVDAFLNDNSDKAFERVIDSLLDSPRYGEKWARHWLDVARFAESGGYEFDGFRPGAYHYRDWVIRAFNDDMPYDQFVRMQLAGDKLQAEDYRAASASGFLVAGPYPGQTTSKTIEGIRYDQLDDMLMTIGGSMLGLTLGCARCHEHKFDPIPHKDYYALASSLAQTVHGSRFIDPNPEVTLQNWERYRTAHEAKIAALKTFAAEQLPQRFESWKATELAKLPDKRHWQVMEPTAISADRSWLRWFPEGIITCESTLNPGTVFQRRGQRHAVPDNERFSISLETFQKNITALRLDAFTDKSLPNTGPGLNGEGRFRVREFKVVARPLDANSADKPQELKLKPVFSAFQDNDEPFTNAVDGNADTTWGGKSTAKKDNAAIFELEPPLAGFASGTELRIEITFVDRGIGRFRFSISTEPAPITWAGDLVPQHASEIRAILAANGNQLPIAQRESMVRWFSAFDPETAKLYQSVRDDEMQEPRPSLVDVYTTIAGGQDVYLLRRGEVDNKQGKADPGFLQVLLRTGSDTPATQQEQAKPPSDPRISLARWMTDVDRGAGPLVARVLANRIWQHHLGEGIVGTPNDFGVQGDKPTHPELLEWLAAQLVSGGWKLKPLHKLIMLSAVYQQSHEISAENLQIDPTNRYLWHYQTRRLDAEPIRDALLAVGGNLDLTMYGPSILDETPRRSVYLRVKRSELLPIMTMFDAPEPTQSVGERISTTVPTQSLTMMNSPFVRQQAERLARRIHPTTDTPATTSVDLAYRIVFARAPTEAERKQMLDFITAQQDLATGDPTAKLDQALTEFCQVLLCLNEFVYID